MPEVHAGMADGIRLDEIVDGQRFGLFTVLIVAVAILAMASDGYDLASMGYIAPELLKQWHLAPTALVPAFSAGIIGMMIGGPAMGLLGDRYGRKPMIIVGLGLIGILNFIITGVQNTSELVVLRFLTGLMVGGVFPNVGSLIAELTPRRIRGRVLVLISLGVPLGIALPGRVAATLVPTYGWKAISLVGGSALIAVALAVALLMPESIKFLVERGDRDDQARRLARRLRPDLTINDHTRLIAPAGSRSGSANGSIRPLFAGALVLVTPMLWICQAANQMANFFSLTWLPTLLQAAGASTASAGASASLFSIGGLAAGLLLLLVIDRLGVVPLVGMFLIGTPLVAGIAMTDLSPTMHNLVIAGAGFCVTGVQLGLTALLGLLYPTAIRSMGTGWTQAAGRLGALAAPVVGYVLLGLHIPISRLPIAPAALLLVGGIGCVVLTWACRRQFGSFRVAEFSIAQGASKLPVDPVGGIA